MKANGIASFGLGCALALSSNPGFATSLDGVLIVEVMPNTAALSDTAREWFESHKSVGAPLDPNGPALGDPGGSLHRIETDLLNLPGEYLTFARSAAPGVAPGYAYSTFTVGNSGDETVPRVPLGDTLRLAYNRSFDASGRSAGLPASPTSIAKAIRNLISILRGVST